MDAANYTIQEAAEIAQMQRATASSWFRKGWLSMWSTDRKAPVAGATTRISKRSVLALSIASALARHGFHPEAACRAARTFTDLSTGPDASGVARAPGELYADGFTALVAYGDGAAFAVRLPKGSVIAGEIEPPLRTAFFPTDPEIAPRGRQEIATVLMLDFIAKAVELGTAAIDGQGA